MDSSQLGVSTGINGIGSTPLPPKGSNNFIGLGIATPSSGMTPKVSYLATNLLRPLERGVTYEFEFLIGSAGEGFEGGDFIGNIVLLGCDNCSLPINGTDCKEGVVDVLGKRQVNLAGGIWFPNKLRIRFTPNKRISKIMIGPGCSSWPWGDIDGVYYILLDDLCIKKAVNIPTPSIINGILKKKSTIHSNKIKGNEKIILHNNDNEYEHMPHGSNKRQKKDNNYTENNFACKRRPR